MCKKGSCKVLGSDKTKWPKAAPCPLPSDLQSEIFQFERVVTYLVDNKISEARDYMQQIPGVELSKFVREHSYYAYATRGVLSDSKLMSRDIARMPSARMKSFILDRDGYICQYCSTPVVLPSTFRQISKALGKEYFFIGQTDKTRHGVFLAFAATWDHVLPMKYGGMNDLDNIVTTCWPCNFGKWSYSVDELGMDDPRRVKKVLSRNWDGLKGLVSSLTS